MYNPKWNLSSISILSILLLIRYLFHNSQPTSWSSASGICFWQLLLCIWSSGSPLVFHVQGTSSQVQGCTWNKQRQSWRRRRIRGEDNVRHILPMVAPPSTCAWRGHITWHQHQLRAPSSSWGTVRLSCTSTVRLGSALRIQSNPDGTLNVCCKGSGSRIKGMLNPKRRSSGKVLKSRID